MSFLDPLVSGVNSLLDPLTSGLDPGTTSKAEQQTTPTTSEDQPTSITAQPTTQASDVVTTPVVTSSDTPATTSEKPSTAPATSTSASASNTQSSIGAPKISSSSSSTSTTLSTSTRSASSSSSAISSSSSSTANLTSSKATSAISSANASSAASTTPTPKPPPDNGNKVSTAGIVIASIVAALVVASIIYALIRFCPPVRRRIDAWKAARLKDRSYREAIDGPAVPEKDEPNTGHHSRAGSRELEKTLVPTATAVPVTGAVAKEIHVATATPSVSESAVTQPKRSSFFGPKQNPLLPLTNLSIPRDQNPRYSWQNSGSEIVHQTHPGPNSTSLSSGVRGYGLGLGRMSMLRNSTLAKTAGLQTRPIGPSIDATQAEIARTKPVQGQEVKRKPVAIGQSHGTPTGSPEEEKPRQQLRVVNPDLDKDGTGEALATARASWVHGDENSLMASPPKKERPRQSVPTIQIDAPTPPPERVSQIGLAISSTPPPGNRGSVGIAK